MSAPTVNERLAAPLDIARVKQRDSGRGGQLSYRPIDPPRGERDLERFAAKYLVTDSGCWEWQANSTPKGYGQFCARSCGSPVNLYAHRVSYTWFKGPVPDGLVVDHICSNPRCVNPDHLEAVTTRMNVLRGRSLFAVQARQTHCKRGHELTAENTYIRPSGFRNCRTCHALDERRRRAAA